MNQLENGYSVSDTDGSRLNGHDILSLRSGLSGGVALSSPGNGPGGSGQDANMAPFFEKHQFSSHQHGVGGTDLEHQIRHQEQQHVLYQEIASQKIKYFKKIAHLEKLIEQVKGEKAQLHVIIETQKQNFNY